MNVPKRAKTEPHLFNQARLISNKPELFDKDEPKLASFCNQHSLFHVKLAPNRFVLPNTQSTPESFHVKPPPIPPQLTENTRWEHQLSMVTAID
jgi:hypothetical protein